MAQWWGGGGDADSQIVYIERSDSRNMPGAVSHTTRKKGGLFVQGFL